VSTVRGFYYAATRPRTISLNRPAGRTIGNEEASAEFGDVLTNGEEDVDVRLSRERERAAVRVARSSLSARNRLILDARILVDEEDTATLADIGTELSLSRERVRQLETIVLDKLRGALKNVETLPQLLP
jgi:RNA polymerase sigma-32 factor